MFRGLPFTKTICLLVLSSSVVALPRIAVSQIPQGTSTIRVPLHGHVPEWTKSSTDLGPLSPTDELRHLTIFLARSTARENAFQHLLIAQQTPYDPLYHDWYTPSELGREFGAADDQIQAVTTWLEKSGLRVQRVSNSKTFIEFSGTISQVSSALGVSFHRYQGPLGTRWSITSDPAIPAELSTAIRSISGLSQVDQYPAFRQGLDGTSFSNCPSGTCTYYIAPGDFATIYNLPNASSTGLNGAGRTIDIVAQWTIDPADVPAFAAITGVNVPQPTIYQFDPNSSSALTPYTSPPTFSCTPDTNSVECDDFAWQGEATLDVERAGSVAPGATLHLLVSEGDSEGDPGTLLDTQYAADVDNPDVLTMSFYACESSSADRITLENEFDGLFQQLAAEGTSVFVSAGDTDATCAAPKFGIPMSTYQLSVNAYCAGSSVTCVGGTEFNDRGKYSAYWGPNQSGFGSALGYIPEGAWNDPVEPITSESGCPTGDTCYFVEGTGGGVSQYLPAPPWQSEVPLLVSLLGRALPDVAFSSSCHDGYFGCQESAGTGDSCVRNSSGDFHFGNFCGTSAATPSMAAIMAIVDQAVGGRQGNANPELYQLGLNPANQVFHDTTPASSGVTSCDIGVASMCNNTPPSEFSLSGGTPGFPLETGFDEVTGWGSINVQNLLADWKPAPSLAASPSALTVSSNGSGGVITLTLIGFPELDANFSCTNLPLYAQCDFGPSYDNGTVTLTISTNLSSRNGGKPFSPFLPVSFAVLAFGLAPMRSRFRRLRRSARWIGISTVGVAAIGLVGLGGCTERHLTPTGNTAVTVTATEGSISASTQIQVTVE